ncbi:MAG: DNA polymerase III subunit [Deltaproteobacteria bacterium]|jgi:DNA polymerase-3 subunit delta'|nr:DNA polymerase III subunit [Deltaproteobacteria bacterium]
MAWSLLGLEDLKGTLGRIIKSGRFPHALLLTGPAKGGKFTLAVDLAKALNCVNPGGDGSPCGECLSCQKIAQGNHPDFMVCQPRGAAQIIAIDDIRELRQNLSYRPFEGKRRVAVIREADCFQEVGGSSLLKTLEEPAPATILILTAISESRVMNTLVSRCVRLRVPPLERARVLLALKEKRNLSGPRAELMTGLAGGALGAALTMDPEETWTRWTALDRLWGLGLGGAAAGIKAVTEWSEGVLEELEKHRKTEQDESKKKTEDSPPGPAPTGGLRRAYLTSLVTFMRLWWRDTVVYAATSDKTKMEGPPPTPAQRKWASQLDMKQFGFYLSAIDQLDYSLNRNIRPEIVLADFWLSVLTRDVSGAVGPAKPK